MKGYKGFNKGLVCRGKQYAENTVFEETEAKVCNSGMHFCENPFSVLEHYGYVDENGNFNEFAEVEALDDVRQDGNNDKYCTTKLKIGAKLDIAGFVKAGVDFILARAKNTESNTGNRSAAVVEGEESIAIATGAESKAKGALGCWIVLAEWDENHEHIIAVKSHKVDGKTVNADTYYMLVGGKFVEAKED